MPFRFPARVSIVPARRLLFSLTAFCVLLGCSRAARAQAIPTQYKTQSFSVFAGYMYDNMDYFQGSKGSGVSFGVDFTRHIHFPVQPSLEGRINLASGTLSNERSYAGGLRGDYRIGKVYPYVDFLVGFGTIHFNSAAAFGAYVGDNSTVYEPGVGVEYELTHSFRAKADFQHQYWNIGHNANTEFQPSLFTVGVAYAVPFRPFHRHGEPHY